VYIVRNLYILIIQNMHFLKWNLISVLFTKDIKLQLFGNGDFINNTVTFPYRHVLTIMTILILKLNTKLVFVYKVCSKVSMTEDWI